jgi:uncharacterized protein YjdB
MAAVATIACEIPLATDVSNIAALLQLSPKTSTLRTDQIAQFVVVGLTSAGDTVKLGVTWSATGGSIVDTGSSGGKHYVHYKAPSQPGQYKVFIQSTVVGASAQRTVAGLSTQSTAAELSDSAVVTVLAMPVASVRVSPAPASATVGQTVQLTAATLDSTGATLSGRVVTWASSNSGLATVSASGLVTGVAVGSATITATSEGKSGTAAVTVAPEPVASVSVAPTAVSIAIGQTAQLTATPRNASGNPLAGRVVTWASSNTAAATVNATGLVTGVAAGPATITATSEGKNGTAAFAVTVTPASVASVSVSPASTSVAAGQTVQLTATPRDASGNTLLGRVVTWTSSDAGLATVSGSGLVTGVAAGAVTVTATSEGQSGSSTVTVTVPVASVSVTPPSLSLRVGQTGQLTATPQDAAGNALTGRVVTWTTNSAAVATVNSSGLVTAQGAGSATITATSEGRSASATITVTLVPVASVTVTPASSNLTVSATAQLTATLRDSAGNVLTGRAVSWVTNNAGVATVSASGLVRAVAAGLATITATSGGISGTAAVTVTNAPVASVTISPAPASILVGSTVQLTATPQDAGGNPLTGRVVTWSSNNTAVATVSNSGLVTGVAAGSATVTATSEGVSGTSAVTVSPPGANWWSNLSFGAFPGAEGFGTTTRAGRGGQVIHVTNLNDAGPGSFRAAVTAAGPRTVIFDVSGNIRLTTPIVVALASGADDPGDGTRDFLTIAGQTAPSPGITLVIDGTSAQGGLYIRTNDVLIQHIRIRVDMNTAGSNRMDCLTLDGARIVVDHVTTTFALASDVGGGAGKLMDTHGAGPYTISNSLIAQSIYGLLVQADGLVSVVRTLFAFNFDRNPQLNGGNHDLILNTVVYNPGDASRPFFAVWGGSSAAPNLSNYIGNKFIAGATYPLATIQYGSGTNPMIAGSRTYIQDNILGAPPIFSDGNIVQVGSPTITLPSPLTILSSGQVEAYVLAHAGARPLDREAVDTRIINDVRNRTDNRNSTIPSLAQNTRVLSIPANQATIRPSGYSVLEEDVIFPQTLAVEGLP